MGVAYGLVLSALLLSDVRVDQGAIQAARVSDLAKGQRTALLVVSVAVPAGPDWDKAAQDIAAALKTQLTQGGLAVLKTPGGAPASEAASLAALKDSGADVLVLANLFVAPGSTEALLQVRVVNGAGLELGRRVVDRVAVGSGGPTPLQAAAPAPASPAPAPVATPAAAAAVPAPAQASAPPATPLELPANAWLAPSGAPPIMAVLGDKVKAGSKVGLAVLVPKSEDARWMVSWWQVQQQLAEALQAGGLEVQAAKDVRSTAALQNARGKKALPLWVIARLKDGGEVVFELNKQGRVVTSRAVPNVLRNAPQAEVPADLVAAASGPWRRAAFRDEALVVSGERVARVDGRAVKPEWLLEKTDLDELDSAISTSNRNTVITNVIALGHIANCLGIAAASGFFCVAGVGGAGSAQDSNVGFGLLVTGCCLSAGIAGVGVLGIVASQALASVIFPRNIASKPLRRAVTAYNTDVATGLGLSPDELDASYFPARQSARD